MESSNEANRCSPSRRKRRRGATISRIARDTIVVLLMFAYSCYFGITRIQCFDVQRRSLTAPKGGTNRQWETRRSASMSPSSLSTTGSSIRSTSLTRSGNVGTGTTGSTRQRTTTPPFPRSQRQIQKRKRQKMKPMPILGYSSRTILAYYDARPLEVGWRLNSLGFPLLGTYNFPPFGSYGKNASLMNLISCWIRI